MRARRVLLCLGVLAALAPPLLIRRPDLAHAPTLPASVVHVPFPALGPIVFGQPSSADTLVEQATRLRREGSYDEAATLFLDALRQRPTDAARLLLAAAEAKLAGGDARGAAELAERALERDPRVVDALLVEGQALSALGELERAAAAFRSYPREGPLAAYAAFGEAEALAALGDRVGARMVWASAIDLGLNTLWRAAAARRIARSALADGEPAVAVRWLARAVADAEELERRRSPIWYDGELVERSREVRAAGLLLELGDAYGEAGDLASQIATFVSIVSSYSAAPEAGAALDRLAALAAADAAPPVDRGVVFYQLDRNREALEVLGSALAGPLPSEEAIRAKYYRALARRDAGEPLAAMEELRQLAERHPASSFARQALMQRARLAETHGSRAQAIAAYLAIADAFPVSDEAGDALLRAGHLQLRDGRAAEARATWRRLGQEHPNPKARARGLYWLGRGLLGLGETAEGTAALEEAARLAPFSYEGIRARDLADGGLGAEPFARPRAARLPDPHRGDDAMQCGSWVRSWSGQTEVSAAVLARLERIVRLEAVGLLGPAQAEALDAAAEAADRPLDLHLLARALGQDGLYGPSIHAALRLAAASPEGTTAVTSVGCLGRLVYPLAFADLVQAQADRYGFDPFLFLALLRQESWFSPRAHSTADARGLSQIIPTTAAGIARELQRMRFELDDLYRPYESIAFGARYFGQLIDGLGGRPLLALAAYNGGSGNVLRWAAGDRRVDPDDFVEAIRFTETRSYVRSILEIDAHYRHLYP